MIKRMNLPPRFHVFRGQLNPALFYSIPHFRLFPFFLVSDYCTERRETGEVIDIESTVTVDERSHLDRYRSHMQGAVTSLASYACTWQAALTRMARAITYPVREHPVQRGAFAARQPASQPHISAVATACLHRIITYRGSPQPPYRTRTCTPRPRTLRVIPAADEGNNSD